MDRRRTLTVEEALALPPPTDEEIARHHEAVAGFAALASDIERRLGRPISDEEWKWAFRRDDDEDDDPAGK